MAALAFASLTSAIAAAAAAAGAKTSSQPKTLGTFYGSISPTRVSFAFFLALAISVRGYRKGSLNRSGAMLALFVGFISCAASVSFGITLIVFFLGSSKVTRIGAEKKKKIEDGHQVGGNRNWVQVAANGGFGTVIAWFFWTRWMPLGLPAELPLDNARHPIETWLQLAYVCHYAACNADTWASELGVLSTVKPRLITAPWREVPTGTNGGVTVAGTAASAAGGLVIGLTVWLVGLVMRTSWFLSPRLLTEAPPQWPVVFVGGAAGLLGSMIDSLLGATLQYSGWCSKKKLVVEEPSDTSTRISGLDVLSNHQVNFFAAAFTGWIGARTARRVLFY